MVGEGAVRVSLNVEWQGGNAQEVVEIERAEWKHLDPAGRVRLLDALAAEHAANHVGWGWHIPDSDDAADA